MSIKAMSVFVTMLISATVLSGCAMFSDGIPPEKLGEYALVVSRIGDRGSNMDTLPSSMQGFENTAYISWINGKTLFPASSQKNMLPGEYEFQVGLGCGNSATCRPSRPYKITVKAGYRYVLTPEGVYVSDRNTPRSKNSETLYQR